MALSTGMPGLVKTSSTRFQQAQSSSPFEVNSVPLSTWIRRGLPPLHRNPFDRMLAAQALVEGLRLLSNDNIFDAYPIRRIW